MTALCMPALLGFIGLAAEATSWEMVRLGMQGAADQAALAASIAYANSGNTTTEAKGVAAAHGFVNGQASTTVAVNQPPSSGNYTGNSSAIEVIITQTKPRLFSGLFLSGQQTISARAAVAPQSQALCMLVLDPSNAANALTLSGGAQLNLLNCNLFNNSTSNNATNLSGGASITAANITFAGNYTTSGGATVTATGSLKTDSSETANPYANTRSIPAYSGCNTSSGSASGTINAPSGTPYVFCGGLQPANSLTLGPGVYIIDGGNLNVPGGTSLTATQGTTIILTSSTGNNYGTFNISGSGTINIVAPTSGPTAGIALWVDGNAPTQNDSFSGQTAESITGAIYTPSQILQYSGQTSNPNGCTQVIAYEVSLSGSATLGANCAGTGVAGASSGPPQLVE